MQRLATVGLRGLLARGDTLEARDGTVANRTWTSPRVQALRAPRAQRDMAARHKDNIDLASEAHHTSAVLRYVICLQGNSLRHALWPNVEGARPLVMTVADIPHTLHAFVRTAEALTPILDIMAQILSVVHLAILRNRAADVALGEANLFQILAPLAENRVVANVIHAFAAHIALIECKRKTADGVLRSVLMVIPMPFARRKP